MWRTTLNHARVVAPTTHLIVLCYWLIRLKLTVPLGRRASHWAVEIDFPVVQAALSGYSDWPMRVIARRLGAPYTLCEVMLDQFIVAGEAAAAKPATSSTSPTKSIPSAAS